MDDTEINNGDEEEFEFSRNYFLAKELAGSGKKSTHKLSDINAIAEEELRLAMSKLEPLHEKESKALMDSYRSLYTQWIFELRCGFGLLMYGFGSKKALIEDFAAKVLTDYPVIVINGFLQSINFKQFLVALAELLWDELRTTRKQAGNLTKAQQPSSSKSIDELLDFLDGPYVEENDCFVCVLVHNIDGPCLRDSETQQYLAKMAACSHVRIVASVDHVNAPLLWDKKMVHTQFNWFWHHVPTYAPYSIEGTFYPLILTHGGTSQSAKTALIVLQSLSSNARSIFKLLAEYLLSHPDEEGMPTSDLYTISRERFLVSNQVTLNSHLTEFRDHQLVKTRKNPDGQDCLYILLSRDAIGKLLPEIDP